MPQHAARVTRLGPRRFLFSASLALLAPHGCMYKLLSTLGGEYDIIFEQLTAYNVKISPSASNPLEDARSDSPIVHISP